MKPASVSSVLPTVFMASLLGFSLSACKKNTTDAAAKPAETAAATPAKPAAASPSTTSPNTTSPGAASTAVTTPGAIPSGYTLVAALGSKPVYTFAAQPARTLKDGVNYVALIDTSRGQILADLYEDKTPATVNNFVTLARNHFYDGILFHRVLDGFMGQTGDPNTLDAAKKTAWGQGGPGYSFPDEIRQSLKFDAPGLLAMANSGPDTNGSQFFITFAPASFLDGKYNLFGRVLSGQDVLSKLTRTATPGQGGQETPIDGATPDKILSVRILSKK